MRRAKTGREHDRRAGHDLIQLTVKREAKEQFCSEEIHTLISRSSSLPIKEVKEENQP